MGNKQTLSEQDLAFINLFVLQVRFGIFPLERIPEPWQTETRRRLALDQAKED